MYSVCKFHPSNSFHTLVNVVLWSIWASPVVSWWGIREATLHWVVRWAVVPPNALANSQYYLSIYLSIAPESSSLWRLFTAEKSGVLLTSQKALRPWTFNGVPYRLYKNAPDILHFCRLMKIVWQRQAIPTAWQRARSILIPKERNLVKSANFAKSVSWMLRA